MIDSESSVQVVPISSIVVDEMMRDLTAKGVDDLAMSLEAQGLLQPIGLRPSRKEEGKYDLRFGQHRLEAARRIGLEHIDAVIKDCDDEDMMLERAAENIYRVGLPEATRRLAQYRLTKAYEEKFPETKRGAGGGRAKARKQKAAEASQKDDQPISDQATEDDSAESIKPDPEPAEPAYKYVARMSGKNPRNLQQENKNTKILGEEAMLELERCDLSGLDIDKLAGIKDEDQRRQAVALVVGTGKPVDDAIEEVKTPLTRDGKPVGDPAALTKADKEMTDDQWVDRYCPEVLASLDKKSTFRRNAALYRAINKQRIEASRPIRKTMAKYKNPGDQGEFYHLMRKFVNVSHPSDWLSCGPCGGSGLLDRNIPKGQLCPKCHGAGFRIQFEDLPI